MDRGTWLCKRPGVAISSTASVALSASRLCKSWCPGVPVWDPNGSALQIGKNKMTIHEQHEKSNKNQQHVSHAMKRSPLLNKGLSSHLRYAHFLADFVGDNLATPCAIHVSHSSSQGTPPVMQTMPWWIDGGSLCQEMQDL